jgi:hypothetical protein
MADLTVSIYDYDSSSNIDVTSRTQTVSINEKIDGMSALTATLKNLDETHEFDDITVTYGGSTVFKGVITSQSDELRGGGALYRYSTWQAADFSLKFERRVVNRVYDNVNVEAIIADLLVKYPCGITSNNVQTTNKLIDHIAFQYEPLLGCIKKLADITGWRWYVDANKDLHFFETDEGTAATVFSTTTTGGHVRNILHDTLTVDTEVDARTANSVWVVGAKTAAPNYIDQYWTGDGNNSVFTTAFVPNYPEVYENGVAKTIEVDKGGTSSKNYVYDKKNRVLIRNAGVLPSGVILRFKYRPTVQIIDYFADSASIAKYGIYEKAIRDKTITEKSAARSRGRAELKRRTSARRTLKFDTRDLTAVSGKKYRVVIPELAIDSYWLCIGIATSISAPDTVNVMKTVELEEVIA